MPRRNRPNLNLRSPSRCRPLLLWILLFLGVPRSCLTTARSFSLLEGPVQTSPRALSRYPDRFADKQGYGEGLRTVIYQATPPDTISQILVKHGVGPAEAGEVAAATMGEK